MDVDVETMVVHDYENGAAIPIEGELFHVSYLGILLVVCMLSVSRISHIPWKYIPWKFIPHTVEIHTSYRGNSNLNKTCNITSSVVMCDSSTMKSIF